MLSFELLWIVNTVKIKKNDTASGNVIKKKQKYKMDRKRMPSIHFEVIY